MVAIHADDLPLHQRAKPGDAGDELLDQDPLRERVDICHVAAREGLVDECDRLRSKAVLVADGATAENLDAERVELARRHHVETGAGPPRRILDRLSDDREGHAEGRAADRNSSRYGDRSDARQAVG